jgi:hypothetical protein
MNTAELRVLGDMTVALTKLRQNECKHLCVENAAADIFSKLLEAYAASQPTVVTINFTGKEQQ